jgi:tungstate transport system permease protein
MSYLWSQLRAAFPLIVHGHGYILSLLWVTVRVSVISTSIAIVLGMPIALALGLGRFRGVRALQILTNATLALPPVLAGVLVLVLLLPHGVFGGLRIAFTLRAVYIAQTLLALPYIVALTPAAIRSLPPGLLAQARALGAGRLQLSVLALREARIGVSVAVIAALASTLSEMAAVIIVGANVVNYDQTLASAIVYEVGPNDQPAYALGIGIVLIALIVLLVGALTIVQQRAGVASFRFRGLMGGAAAVAEAE